MPPETPRQIDKLIQHLARFGAQALVVASNAPVVARLPAGDRTSNQTIDHATVVAMIQEVAPPGSLADLRQMKATQFRYDNPQLPVSVEVAPSPGAWRVVLSAAPAAPEPPAPTGPPPAVVSAPPPVVNAPLSIPAPRRISSPAVVALAAGSLPAAPVISAVPAPAALSFTTQPPPALASVPPAPGDAAAIERLLRKMTAAGASDLHLSTGCPPLVRLHGEILRLEEAAPYTTEGLRAALEPVLPPRNREEFERRRDTDFALEIPGLARFRVNLFMDRNGVGAVFRRIPFEIVPPEKLGLTPAMLEFCNLSKGLVLVTGPTGSGKSTTLATLIDRINATRADHIITIEDPIEFVHNDKKCLINQREVRVHTEGFRAALRAALREDPDIVLVGEMRDLETIEIAIETAETGHLVFGTLHTTTAPSTVDRIIDQFPPDRQAQIRTMLSESLKGVVAQTLCKRVGGGRIAAYEVLVGTAAVANLIREAKTFQLYGTMQSSRNFGMITLGDALLEHVLAGRIEPREAYMKAVNKGEIRQLMANNGVELPDLV